MDRIVDAYGKRQHADQHSSFAHYAVRVVSEKSLALTWAVPPAKSKHVTMLLAMFLRLRGITEEQLEYC